MTSTQDGRSHLRTSYYNRQVLKWLKHFFSCHYILIHFHTVHSHMTSTEGIFHLGWTSYDFLGFVW